MRSSVRRTSTRIFRSTDSLPHRNEKSVPPLCGGGTLRFEFCRWSLLLEPVLGPVVLEPVIGTCLGPCRFGACCSDPVVGLLSFVPCCLRTDSFRGRRPPAGAEAGTSSARGRGRYGSSVSSSTSDLSTLKGTLRSSPRLPSASTAMLTITYSVSSHATP